MGNRCAMCFPCSPTRFESFDHPEDSDADLLNTKALMNKTTLSDRKLKDFSEYTSSEEQIIIVNDTQTTEMPKKSGCDHGDFSILKVNFIL